MPARSRDFIISSTPIKIPQVSKVERGLTLVPRWRNSCCPTDAGARHVGRVNWSVSDAIGCSRKARNRKVFGGNCNTGCLRSCTGFALLLLQIPPDMHCLKGLMPAIAARASAQCLRSRARSHGLLAQSSSSAALSLYLP
eukprot:4875510-Pleurochrysis_carterae.AAC.3